MDLPRDGCDQIQVGKEDRGHPPGEEGVLQGAAWKKNTGRVPGIPKVSSFLKESFLFWLDKKKINEGTKLAV